MKMLSNLNFVIIRNLFLFFYLFIASPLGAFDETKEIIHLITENDKIQFEVEIAETADQRQKGLMGRRTLDVRSGMLFLYDKPRRVFIWMKDTLLSLDIIFLSKDGAITKIYSNAKPLSLDTMSAGDNTAAVLEVKGGVTQTLDLEVGDCIQHLFFLSTLNMQSCNFKD